MEMPPLNLASTATSGPINQSMAFDSSGFVVNYGNGNGTGGTSSISQDVKSQLIVAAIVGGVALWLKHKRA